MEKLSNLTESTERKVSRNSELFDNALKSKGMSYADVYRILNEHGITDFNYIIDKDGNLIEQEDKGYLGDRDYHGSDNGERTHAQKELDCVVGNIQERLFCIDNIEFIPNPKATTGNVDTDKGITTKHLDLIHKPTGEEVELKNSFDDKINDKYNTVIYKHRDAHFAEFMRNGYIVIVNFPYLNKVAVFDYRNFKDPEKGKDKGSVRVIVPDKIDEYGKHWDIVSIWSGLLIDYDMMKKGNYKISEKVSEIVKRREIK